MPSKPTAPKPQDKIESDSKLPKTRKLNFNFLAKINITYVLFFLLMIASFLIGVLVTKVQYLEKGVSIVQNSNNTAAGEITGQDLAPQAPIGPVDIAVGNLPPIGDENAPVKIVEFSDFNCPFCGRFFEDTFPQIKEEYIDTGKAVFYFRQFPIVGSNRPALASECANEQGAFWAYHDLLFENQQEWRSIEETELDSKFSEYATTLGLNGSQFNDCLSNEKFLDNITKDLEDGSAAGVDGVPATFVNGYLIVGAVPYEEFKAQIEARLEEK
jgi:protein-disulfide isomerase